MTSSLYNRLNVLLKMVGNTRIKCLNIDSVDVCIKLEYENPTGSHKDRVALYMIKGLIDRGNIKEGECVAELSSGNTAVSVAWAASFLGLRSLLMVEKYASQVKKNLIRLYGGSLFLVEKDINLNKAKEIAEERGCVFLNQYGNEDNFYAHYETTGKEILEQTKRKITHFIMGIGTGGTITGVGTKLKEELGNVEVIGVVPKGSALSTNNIGKPETIEGLMSLKVPELYTRHKNVIDKIVDVAFNEALKGIKMVYRNFSLLPGPSTGASFTALLKLIDEGHIEKGSFVAIIAADRLTRYPNLVESFKM